MTRLFDAHEAELLVLRARVARLEGENAELRREGARLREELGLLGEALDHLPLGLLLAEAGTGRVLLQNRALHSMLRRPLAGTGPRRAWEVLQPERPGLAECPVARLLATGDAVQGDYLQLCGDGVRRWIGLSGTAIHDGDGRMTAALLACAEPDGRQAAAAALTESEARLRLAQEAADMGVYERDLRTGQAHWTAPMFRIWGLDPSRGALVSEEEYLSLLLPEDRAAHRARRDALREDPQACRFAHEFRIRRPSTGEVRWIASRGEFVRDEAGRAILVRGTNHDITAQREAEQRLALSEARFRGVLDATPAMVWLTDAEGRCTFLNRRWRALTGQAEADGLGIGRLQAVHPEDRDATRAALQDAQERQAPFRLEYRLRRADGVHVWVLDTGEPRFDADGSFLGHVGAVLDISDRREAEERRVLLVREVDHRARNALTVVQSILALTRAEDPERFRASVQGRIAALARAHTLLAREGWASAELLDILQEELAAYEAVPGLPPRILIEGPRVVLVAGAAQPLAMALHELATNAAKYGALSAPEGRLSVVWRREAATGGLTLVWQEAGGPALRGPPGRRGFGTSVIAKTVERQLGGSAALEWPAEGLRCTITLPPDQLCPSEDTPEPGTLG